ncbi:MAG: efflux RND transporter periplasmic adaptor subunit [Alphaproteobacteria bacterium]|nr:efflux RND transporter periplasmic adaptor subunit [Alphaproteobacteria bacterium]
MRAILGILVVLAAAAGGGWLYWDKVMVPAKNRSAQSAPPAGFAMPVEAAPVIIARADRRIAAVGTLRSNESVTVRPEIAGRIVTIGFEEGQKVRRGQVLIQLDTSVEKAELAQSQAQLALARANAERADELVRRGAGTQRTLDEARATLRTTEAAIQLGQARIEKMTIAAPFEGVAGLRKVSIGAFVQAGADIVNIEQIDTLKVDFRVPEVFLAAVRQGQKISVTVDAFAGEAFEGEVLAIDPLVDAGGRSIVIRARLANPGDKLRPGIFTRVALSLATREDAVFVPEQALVPQGDRHFLYKVVDGGEGKPKVARMIEVKLGIRRAGKAEVTEGLAKGDVVVTAGLLKIRDGAPVQVVPSPPPAGQPPQGTQPQGQQPAGPQSADRG